LQVKRYRGWRKYEGRGTGEERQVAGEQMRDVGGGRAAVATFKGRLVSFVWYETWRQDLLAPLGLHNA
jgi:hypothetical protein